MLVASGALEPRSHLADAIDPWLGPFLADRPPDQVALLRAYASWSVLRRARTRAARGLARPTAPRYVRTRITVAADFLAWLDSRGLTLADAAQADVDLWLTQGATTRRRLRDFLKWTHRQGKTGALAVEWIGRRGLACHLLAEDARWPLLRRCLHDDTTDLRLRVAGALVLVYGQVPTRIVELTRNDLTTNEPDTYLTLAQKPVLLPPALADLLTRLADENEDAPWLFPSAWPLRHRDPCHLGKQLNDQLKIFVRPARGAALADLAADLPSPVLADLLGLSIFTASRWTGLAAKDWAPYIATRANNPPPAVKAQPTSAGR